MPSIQEAKDAIVEAVTAKQGLKATELVVVLPTSMLIFDIPSMIEALVREGLLVEVEYVLPSMPQRAKSFLLPKGSTVDLTLSENSWSTG
jgi:hypothetical protein